jgi:hypothetical protein
MPMLSKDALLTIFNHPEKLHEVLEEAFNERPNPRRVLRPHPRVSNKTPRRNSDDVPSPRSPRR